MMCCGDLLLKSVTPSAPLTKAEEGDGLDSLMAELQENKPHTTKKKEGTAGVGFIWLRRCHTKATEAMSRLRAHWSSLCDNDGYPDKAVLVVQVPMGSTTISTILTMAGGIPW